MQGKKCWEFLMQDNITVVDIGSGSMKASVFTCSQGSVESLGGISRGFRLCSRIGTNISDNKIRVTTDFFEEVLALAREHNSTKIIAVATQAARKAANFSRLRQKILKKTGINLQIISGTEEATLAARSTKHLTQLEKFISFDIGCGSVEIAKFDKVLQDTWSLPISTLDLVKGYNVESAQMVIKDMLDRLPLCNENFSKFVLIGGGGTLKVASFLINRKTRNLLTYDEIEGLFDALKDKTEEERIAYGVPKIRADILPFGLLIILQIMQHVGKDKVFLTSGNLRASLALDYFKMI
ncbi:MAG: hypothetical protein LBB16_04145 [Puniceicoccales bacterium]|jgi:exopolyphosphatase/guanosine-5'-triphosphate,3'-diphosphate pyrophosphatase|nr:hypothetical protein [Puniceicoccales bacterium]